jgi:hypothetical protein
MSFWYYPRNDEACVSKIEDFFATRGAELHAQLDSTGRPEGNKGSRDQPGDPPMTVSFENRAMVFEGKSLHAKVFLSWRIDKLSARYGSMEVGSVVGRGCYAGLEVRRSAL